MTTLVGGLRARFIHDSTFETLRAALDALGWFDSGRRHLPINLIPTAAEWDAEIPLNTVAVSSTNTSGEDAELGSNLIDDRTVFYVDIYAQDDALGKHLAYDVRDLLRGKMPSIGRARPVLDVLDLSQVPPAPVTIAEIDNVVVDRANSFARDWEKHWWVVRFDVLDSYGDELDDGTVLLSIPGPSTAPGPDLFPQE